MSKKNSGSYNTPKIKSSSLLPQVFNTDVNKKWLDSTLDQMISKGSLKNVEGFIGDKSGKNRNANEIYVDKQKLSPTITVKDDNKNLIDAITAEDIANSINIDISDYNYNAAYATKQYSYRPPINIHKFINYTNYAWVDQMPTYQSVRTLNAATVDAANPSIATGTTFPASPSDGDYFDLNDGGTLKTHKWVNSVKKWQVSKTTDAMYSKNSNNAGFTTAINPVTLSADQLAYTIVDNNNTFALADQMLIKFTGDGWHPDAHKQTYLVSGTGSAIKLIPWYSWVNNTQLYPDTTKTTITVGGIWDETTVTIVAPNKASPIWNDIADTSSAEYRTHFGTMMAYYNANTNRLPLFDGFIFTNAESNKTQWIEDTLVAFGPTWVNSNNSNTLIDLQYHKLYFTGRNSITGDVYVTKLVDAEFVNATTVRQFIVPGTSEEVLAKYKHQLVGFDTLNYDKSTSVVTAKDYIVSTTDSPFKTAWSRNNKWTDVATLKKINKLVFGGIGLKNLIDPTNLARRPIIEFDGKLNLWNWANNLNDNQWLGIADFIVKPTGDYALETVGGVLRFATPNKVEINPTDGMQVIFSEGEHQSKIWKITLNGSHKELTPNETLVQNHGVYVREAVPDTLDLAWSNSDAWFDNGRWKTGQQRTTNNQMPLFKLYTAEGTAIETLEGAVFKGSRLFNYKIGTSQIDPELGHKLSYKDSNGIAEYQFENYLYTELYYQNVKSTFDRDITHRRKVPGQYFFKNNNKLSTLYKQSENIGGAETLVSTDVPTTLKSHLTIPVGHSSWRADRVVQLHQSGKECVVTEIQNGVYLDKTNIDHTNIYVGQDLPVVFNNLLETGDVRFKTVAGVDIETTPQDGVSVTRYGNDITLAIASVAENFTADGSTNNYPIAQSLSGTYSVVKVTIDGIPHHTFTLVGQTLTTSYVPGVNAVIVITLGVVEKLIIDPVDATLTNDYTITPLTNYDSINHNVEINGIHLSPNAYTINADTIVIPRELFKVNDIVDLKYTSSNNANKTTNVTVPNVLKHNPTNELIKTFTPSETIAHWQSIITSTPGFEGDMYATNNYEAVNTHTTFGGNLFIYKDLSIVHDAIYASNKLDTTTVLVSAGEEWDNFKNRFASQVSRLYETKAYSSVRALANDVAKSITVIRKGGELYSTSNMAYFEKAQVTTLVIDTTTYFPNVKLADNIHSDDNIQDHAYVYVTEKSGTKMVARLAVKDQDYIQTGNNIHFTYQPLGIVGTYPSVAVYYYQMDTASYVPPSLTKLRLAPGTTPTCVAGVLTGHDGSVRKGKTTADVADMNSANFDVVLAVLFELEKRVYAGLSKADSINSDIENIQYGFTSRFTPNKSRETWYTLETVNDVLYKHYKQWKAKYSRKDFTPAPYDASESKTWNFSTIAVGGHFRNNTLPGHWTGAYEVLFGTQTPHINPWHMLGFAFKPLSWDSKYSWTDAAKRAALIDALKRGVVDTITDRQDTEWANHMWDWTNNCPVLADGSLDTPENVLGSVSGLNASQKFKFGDYAGLEGIWRASSAGKAAIIDTLVKLNPTTAFTEFYAPGTRQTEKHLDILDQENNINTPKSNLIPSKVYKRVISDVSLTTIDQFPSSTFIKLAGPEGGVDAVVTPSWVAPLGAMMRYMNGASISSRGRNLTSTPAVYTSFTTKQVDTSSFTYKTKEVQHVSSGIAQALYNHTVRNNISYSITDLHKNSNTQLGTQLRGFSSKHLLDFKTDSFDNTNHTLSENDFTLDMYNSPPINIAIASSITIENTLPGWKISGAGYGKQEFNFFAPDTTNTTSYTNVPVGTFEVKAYKNFAPVHSVLEYEASLDKIQDVYSFIRGYYAYLESIGFTFPYSGDSVALASVKWAMGSKATDTKTFDLGTNLKFAPAHGSILELNTGIYKENTIAKLDSTSIDASQLVIDRVDDILSMKTTANTIIGSAGFVVVQHNHIALLQNKTTFGVVINDNVKNIIQEKIAFRGLITDLWDGQKRAPGYLVFDNKIVENFDSSVQAIDNYYKSDSVDFNPAITKLEDITIGNSNKELAIHGNEFDAITKRNYYQGLIKQSGTIGGVDKIERKFANNNLDITVNEQYMLSRSHFGNKDKLDAVEFTLENNNTQANVQAIKFSDYVTGETKYDDVLLYKHSDKRFVNPFKTSVVDKFATQNITAVDSANLTAGSVLDVEAKYKSATISEMGTVYDKLADYAITPAWVNTRSYKLNDTVRHTGRLLQCAVASTTVTQASDNITIQGIAVSPNFAYGTIASIDGVTWTAATTGTQFADMALTGDVVNPTVTPSASDTFTIDGTAIAFNNPQEVDVVTGPASVTANVIDPQLDDVTGKTITINSTTINFDTTPADITENFTGDDEGVTPSNVVENFTGDASTVAFTISQALGASTYDVSTITVDGSAVASPADYSLSGQVITFTTAPVAAAAIVVTLVHDVVVDLKDTFTIVENITAPTSRFVEAVTVGGVVKTDPTHYSISGQSLIFTAGNEPTDGVAIVVTVAHTSLAMTTAQIVSKINSELAAASVSQTPGVDGAIFADLSPTATPVGTRLRVRHWTTNIASDLVITGNAAIMVTELGFATATVTEPPLQQVQNLQQPLNLAGIVTQINAVAGLLHITASASGTFLKIDSDSSGVRSSLTITGNISAALMGTQLTTTASTVSVQKETPLSTAVAEIITALSNAGITGVSITTTGNVFNIISTNATLVLAAQGDSFLGQAGISEFGTVNKVTDDTISNTIVPAEWIDISHKDPALFNVWVANDSDGSVESINSIKTKFFGWNIFQVQNNGLHPTTSVACGICAGTTTKDGNDAQITTNVSHNLAVGDYIMLLNTTTVPNIDGIHKVTRVESTDKFYVDEYIDTCGTASSIMLLRSVRFDTIADRTTALASTSWNVPPAAKVWTDYDANGDRSVNVFTVNYPNSGGVALDGAGYRAGYLNVQANIATPPYTLSTVRSATKQILNTDLDNITVYDYENNQPILDLELFDPMRGIIPGVADAEIDVKSVNDVAIYNTSTEETYEMDDDNAWGEAEIGRRWWDTGRVRYYDYDQGDINDKSTNWGKQFVGSEIVVWEWTKSTVAPDDYAKAVTGSKVMFGTPASGTAYAEFDIIKNQNEYYYTLNTVWNPSTSTNDNVYYFWVRGKATIGSADKNIITSEVENIIKDPSANGIYWFSVVDKDAIIVSDIWNFVNKKVVLQLNKKITNNNHQNWILVSKDTDIIPDYWYTGLVNNLAGQDQNEIRIPDFSKHPYARYGDDRAKFQAWFDDLPTARKTAIDIINRLLVSVNVYDDCQARFLLAVKTLKLSNDTWEWTDYVTDKHLTAGTYITDVETVAELEALDVTEYETAKIEILDADNVDRSEFYTYTITDGWLLTKKKNATVNWSELRLGKSYAWDIEAWDSTGWSNTSIAEWWSGIVALLRDTMFTNNHQAKFNKFFFGIVDYAMSRNKQVDWAMKTSYIRLGVNSSLNQQKKYKKDSVATIEGYINDIKPFHVKISETSRTFNKLEEAALKLTESHKLAFTIKADNVGANFEGLVVDANASLTKDIVMINNGATVKKYVVPTTDAILETHANQNDGEWDITSVKDGATLLVVDVDYYQIDQTLMFTVVPTGNITVGLKVTNDYVLSGGDASTTYTDANGLASASIISGGTALQSDLYNKADNNELERSTEAHLRPQEVVMLAVQTNRAGSTDDSETRTFAYLRDVFNREHVFALQGTKSTTTTSAVGPTTSTIAVTTASKLATAEYILVNEEVMQVSVSGTTVTILQRAVNGTFEHKHLAGSRITDITDAAVSSMNPVTDRRFNDESASLLDSVKTDEAVLLNNLGKGVVL